MLNRANDLRFCNLKVMLARLLSQISDGTLRDPSLQRLKSTETPLPSLVIQRSMLSILRGQ